MFRELLLLGVVALSSSQTFSNWLAWNTNCTTDATCKGPMVRLRFCTNDATLQGCGAASNYIETHTCCAQAQWGEWSALSECSNTCGGCGQQKRTRLCKPSGAGCPQDCQGDDNEVAVDGCDDRKVCMGVGVTLCCIGTKTINTTGKYFFCKE